MNVMKKKSRARLFAVCTAVLALCASCESTDKERYVADVPDYTSEDAVAYEIQEIQKALEKEPVKSLWRAKLLEQVHPSRGNIQSLLADCEEKVVSLYKKELEGRNYLDALRYYQSLQAVDYKGLSSLSQQERQLRQNIVRNVPGLTTLPESQNTKVADLIKGTVTVFVDKGIKVENGKGYADGVLGSGFFISKNGYIVTNHHVIEDCVNPEYEGFARLYIRLAEDPETRIPAKIIGYDKSIDLALLKTEVDAPYIFNLGSSADLNVGDKVYAIGSPLGLDRTLTSGIISSKDRDLFTSARMFQIDAAVNSGNSGGPLIDEQGNVQAIVFAGVQNYQGLNFAIPVEYLKNELPILYAGGARKHPWICAYGKTKRLPGSGVENEGLNILYTMPGGSALRSGISVGDTVVAVNAIPVSSREDFGSIMMQCKADTIVRITVQDENGRTSRKIVYLEQRPEEPGLEVYKRDAISTALIPLMGMELVASSTSSKRQYTVKSVIKGSLADDSGFNENDTVQVIKTEVSEEEYLIIQLYARKRANAFIDVAFGLRVPLDSLYYF